MDNAITTAELFRLLSLSIGKEKPASVYMVAKVLGVAQTTARLWHLGATVMDEANAEKAASMLGLNLEFVILSLQAERMKKTNLEKIAAIFERAAIAAQTHGTRAASGFALVALSPFVIGAVREACRLCKTSSHFFERPQPRFDPRLSPV